MENEEINNTSKSVTAHDHNFRSNSINNGLDPFKKYMSLLNKVYFDFEDNKRVKNVKLDLWADNPRKRKNVVMYRHILNDKDEFIEEEENPVYIADVIRVMLHKNDKINISVVNFNKTANILDLSLDQYGLFCDVIPCQKHFRSRYVNRITLCYTKI